MSILHLRLLFAAPAIVVLTAGALATQQTDSSPAVDFQREVRPILADKCFQCHGPDEAARQAELRLDTREGALGRGPRGAAVVPGDIDASLLVQRITNPVTARRMPPALMTNKVLTDEQIGILTRWIAEGAAWDQHWSFEPITRPTPPAVDNEAWVRNPIDRFILARLEAEGLAPAPEADRRALARRVALDLTGLPPDPGTLATFLADTSEEAYEKLVDRLLQSGHWGEHRTRYWLDAARYGDTHGIHIDNYREMYAYRDWVIRAFNDNKPFDEFTVEQVAGDLLPDPTLDQLIASGFQRNNITTNEGGVLPEEYEAIYAKDRAETIGAVFLGLTVGCATCHDHKFDPVAQREFYAMTAFFRNTTQRALDGNVKDSPPILVVPRDEDRDTWDALHEEAADVEAALDDRPTSAAAAFDEWLAEGTYRDISTPLERAAEILSLALEDADRPAVLLGAKRRPIKMQLGATVEEGAEGHTALMFGAESWAELPPLEIGTATPFSIALWLYQPEGDDGFTVAGQYDPEDGNRGWSMRLGSGQLSFVLTGDTGARVAPVNTERLPSGEWTHIVVTHDGSGERAGLHVYRNGEIVEEEGSDIFAKVEGSTRTERPLYLGRGDVAGNGDTRYFEGGGVADLRVFDRALSVQEAKVVSQWRTLQEAAAKSPEALTEEERAALLARYLATEDEEYRRLIARRQEIDRERREVRRRGSITHVMQERPDSEPEAHVLYRGMYDQPRERVIAGTPAVLPPIAESLPRNRLGLADWLVDETNPLMSRVTVNRFWQQIFGTGLVATSEDFGAQGELPSHPELLDYLAADFRASGWDVKEFFRTLVTSATYRQAARSTPDRLERDPDNRLLSRGPRFRMDAEMVRDYALAASGLLVRTIGGPSVKPYQPDGVWSRVAMPQSDTRFYERDSGEDLYRRSVYTFWKRTAPPASMNIFDAPTREHSTVRRERTNTPLQALVTMNDTQFIEAARYLAQRAMRDVGDDFDLRLDYLTTRLLVRNFTDAERAVARLTYEGFVDLYVADAEAAKDLLDVGESSYDAGLPVADSAAWTMLTSQLMNLDEVLNK